MKVEWIDIKNIHTGDIILISTDRLLPDIIHEFQELVDKDGAKFNHAARAWWCYDELMVIEADKEGIVQTNFIKEYMEQDCYKVILVLRPEFPVDGSEYGRFMLPYCRGHRKQAKYSFRNLFIAFPIYLLTFGKVWVGTKKTDDTEFACGHFCAFTENNFRPNMYPEPERIAPVHLYLRKEYKHYLAKSIK